MLTASEQRIRFHLLRALRIVGVNFAILVTLLIGVELLAFTYYSVRGAINRLTVTMPDDESETPGDAYPDRSWLDAYVAEADDPHLHFQWQSYTNWRHERYAGKFITVDEEGVRTTWNPDSSDDATSDGVAQVAMFGGSAVWGTGDRNDFTIPSELSKVLAREYPRRFHVTNYGEVAYVSTQSAITLLREIQAGHTPDIVIFYEGFNDVFSAYHAGVAGLPYDEWSPAREFNILNASRPWALYGDVLKRTNTYTLAAGIRRTLLREPILPPASPITGDPEALMKEVIDIYTKNMELVTSMARTWGFDCRFYWQPTVFTKTTKTPAEQRNQVRTGSFQEFYRQVMETLHASDFQSTYPDFRNLSGMFEGYNRSAFIDQVHTTEAANEMIANHMAVDLAPLLTEKSARHPR